MNICKLGKIMVSVGLFRKWIIWYVWILMGGIQCLYIMSIFSTYVWSMKRIEQTSMMEHYNCCLLFIKESVDECWWNIEGKTKHRVKKRRKVVFSGARRWMNMSRLEQSGWVLLWLQMICHFPKPVLINNKYKTLLVSA